MIAVGALPVVPGAWRQSVGGGHGDSAVVGGGHGGSAAEPAGPLPLPLRAPVRLGFRASRRRRKEMRTRGGSRRRGSFMCVAATWQAGRTGRLGRNAVRELGIIDRISKHFP